MGDAHPVLTPHHIDDSVTLWHGDCLDVLASLAPDSVDAVVTDPPYDLTSGKRGGTGTASVNPNSPAGRSRIGNGGGGFMGKSWDATGVAFTVELWSECLRVLKPGGHLLAFGGTRTYHRMAVAVEDAGFEIRDTIAWLYGSGFPKSRNLDGDWQGWGTALKPANEPIIVARKSLAGTVAANVLEHGTGALNIDGCRTGSDGGTSGAGVGPQGDVYGAGLNGAFGKPVPGLGRWPTNVILDEHAAADLDQQTGILTSGLYLPEHADNGKTEGTYGAMTGRVREAATYGDSGGASRFFPTFRYEAKAPTVERPEANGVLHPTVKPLDLMRWLVRLVTPPQGVVLDPFAGSGTTAEACVIEGFRCVTVEREADYLPLIVARLTKPIQAALL